MKFAIESNKKEIKSNSQWYDDKMMKLAEYFKEILASYITSITDNIDTLK